MAVVQQAGAVVIRTRGGQPKVLLVTAKRNPRAWIFPKGHIEAGETAKAAAVREAHEEGGVRGTVVGPAGQLSFDVGPHRYRVRYFVLTTTDRGSPEAGRSLAWCRFDEALARIGYANARALLRRARPLIEAAVETKQRRAGRRR